MKDKLFFPPLWVLQPGSLFSPRPTLLLCGSSLFLTSYIQEMMTLKEDETDKQNGGPRALFHLVPASLGLCD